MADTRDSAAPSTPPTTAAQRQALELLAGASRVVLCGHMRPDGDCLGSQAALCAVLERLGKTVWIYNPDPVQPQLDYLERDVRFHVYKGGELPTHDLAVMLDFCELSRTGAIAAALGRAKTKKLIVDHHLFHGEPWWDGAYVDTTASATGVLVRRIARELGVTLDARIARGVFTAIVTDTGWFKYSNTDAETFAIAGELTASGVEPAPIYASIYQRNSRTQPLGVARALSRLQYVADGRIAVVDLPLPAPGEAELPDGDDVLDLLRAVGRVEVVLFLREVDGGTVKLSARSKGVFDVNRLARGFGGGGHAKASGATIGGALGEVRAKLVEAAVAQLASAESVAR
jgi:phosphoesterase RecJ-like protein